MRILKTSLSLTGLAVVLLLRTANASVLVHVIQNDPSSRDASVVPSSSLPSADFSTAAINFASGSSESDSLAKFLGFPTFTNQQNGFNPNQNADNTFLELTAAAYLNAGNNSFVVGHDDGVVLTFADPAIGTVVYAPGPTSFDNNAFNVNVARAGLYAFDLKYTECCAGPAGLALTFNGKPPVGTAPEPSAFSFVGLGGVVLAVAQRRLRRRAAHEQVVSL